MAKWFLGRLLPALNIKKGEASKTFLMFLYFFLVITAYYILKPVRDSLFIEWLGAENLPFVYLGDAFFIGGVVYVYTRFAARIEPHKLITYSALFLLSNLLIFRWIYSFHLAWVSFAFYIWVGIFSILTVTQFWTCANDIFNAREAKRLFGFIGSGGIAGGITGGLITSSLSHSLGTENLLLVSAAILLIAVAVMNLVWRTEMEGSQRLNAYLELEKRQESPKGKWSQKTVSLILASKYLLLMVALVFLIKAVATLVDFQFKTVIQEMFVEKDARTAFLGTLYAVLNGTSLCVQVLMTGFVLKRFGVATALILLPIGLFMGSAALLIYPVLWSACILKISESDHL